MFSSSMYAAMTSWFTPSFLFIFINLVIGTIAITSRFASKRQHHQLARSPSMLHRLMSFNISSYYCSHEPVLHPDSPPFDRIPSSSSFLERVRSFNLSFRKEAMRPDPVEPAQPQLSRSPLLVERIKSIKFYRSESTKQEEKEQEPESELKSKLESEPEPEPKLENRGGGCLEDENDEEGEAVDAKADDFINRFKQQLRLQRLDSILRYRDMLKRY